MSKKEVLIPDLGTDSVDVTQILVSVGDEVKQEQGLINVEGDKASMDIPSPFDGKVVSIALKTGDKISSGMVLGVIEVDGEGEDAKEQQEEPSKEPSTAVPLQEVKESAASDKESSLKTKKEESEQADLKKPESVLKVAAPGLSSDSNINKNYIVYASPSVRHMAAKFGVDLKLVTGTGRKGRILASDVEAWIKQTVIKKTRDAEVASLHETGMNIAPLPHVDHAKWGEVEEVPLTRIQKISGPVLHRNWVTIPHVTQFEECDVTDLESFRQSQNEHKDVKARGYKISLLVFIMKAVAKTLEIQPKMNSSLSSDGEKLIIKKYINLGIAVDTPNGLVVPVIRNVNKRTISDLSEEIFATAKKARVGQLSIDDLKGSSFTISSLGGIGGTQFTPIVNAPDVGILGVSRVITKPLWNGTEFVPRKVLPLALSYDHRVIDGAQGAKFVVTLRNELEDIRKIIL